MSEGSRSYVGVGSVFGNINLHFNFLNANLRLRFLT